MSLDVITKSHSMNLFVSKIHIRVRKEYTHLRKIYIYAQKIALHVRIMYNNT